MHQDVFQTLLYAINSFSYITLTLRYHIHQSFRENNVLKNHIILGLVNSVKPDKKLIIRLTRQIKYHIVKDDRPAPKQKQSLETVRKCTK